jgi:hypothetical protein
LKEGMKDATSEPAKNPTTEVKNTEVKS